MNNKMYNYELLQNIFHNAKVGIAICNAKDNRLEMVNPTFAKIHGYEQHELIGVSPEEVFAPECMSKLSEHENTKSCAISDVAFETIHFKKDGSPVNVSVHITIVKDDNGEIKQRIANIIDISSRKNSERLFKDNNSMGILGIARDITEKHLAQENLLLKEFALNKISESVFLIAEDSKFHYVNESASNTFGYSKEELLNMGVVDLDKNMSMQIWKDHWEEIKKNKTTLLMTRHTRKDGISFPIEVSSNYFEYKGVGYSLAISRDITERKKFEDRLALQQKELQSREEMFRTLAENLPDNIARWDLQGRYIYINPRHEKTLEMSAKDVVGNKMSKLFSTHSQVVQALEDVIKTGKGVFGILQSVLYSDGREEIHEVDIIPELDNSGHMVSVLGIGRDITKQLKLQEELITQKDFQDSLLKGIAKAGMSVNVVENGRYIYTNNIELAREYGYDDNFIQNRPNFLDTIHPDDKAKISQMHHKRLLGEEVPTTYTVRQINKKNEIREHEVSVVLIPNTNPIQTLVVNKDVTEQKNIEKRIEFMAHHDILTELPNRVLLKDRANNILSLAKENSKKSAFIFIDLDGFKNINDTLGHSIGDIVLKTVAQRLLGCLRASDTLSRHGGDEFVVIVPEIETPKEVEIIATKILQQFHKSFVINNQILSITASLGISIYPDHGKNFEHLLQNSDTAMYKAKEKGKNTYCFFTQQMKHNMIGFFQMQNDLKDAIKNKEFVLHYQPQIDLSKNKIIGAEALIRWKHPSMSVVPPMSFISVAESCGYIVEIGEWVISEACRQCAIWNKNGKDIVIAVNVSAVQFKRGNLIEVIKNALHSSGLNPKYLELELTESILISDTENILHSIKAIKELGVLLSIDDFGTGYSSLAYLKRFAVDKLKIDQSFVKDIVKDKEDASIVKTIIQMAKSFNLKSIAEGVENEEVLNILKKFDCVEVQGYHFAKPMDAIEFSQYYKKTQKKLYA